MSYIVCGFQGVATQVLGIAFQNFHIKVLQYIATLLEMLYVD